MSQTLNMELQGDGLIENLYHYLWSKDSLFNQSPQVNIPDTVVYRYEQPAFWYFTSRAKPAIAKGGSPRSPNQTNET